VKRVTTFIERLMASDKCGKQQQDYHLHITTMYKYKFVMFGPKEDAAILFFTIMVLGRSCTVMDRALDWAQTIQNGMNI